MNHKGTQLLETRRLLLRPFCENDAALMFCNWASDPEVAKFLTWPVRKSVGETERVVRKWVSCNSDSKNYRWAIELKTINEPIGSISAVNIDDSTESVIVGYCIGRNWWGRGITAEALKKVVGFFFYEVGANCVCAHHDTRNPNSGKVMRKCGMTYEGTWRARGMNNQGVCDEAWYSILKKEYRLE